MAMFLRFVSTVQLLAGPDDRFSYLQYSLLALHCHLLLANLAAANHLFITRLHDRQGETPYSAPHAGERKILFGRVLTGGLSQIRCIFLAACVSSSWKSGCASSMILSARSVEESPLRLTAPNSVTI